uniref:ANIS5_cation-bd domain-containing protein n=1 Tax=Panagrellus redivivus TaxID=6233 RepID=A0A7E4W4I3_PANRE
MKVVFALAVVVVAAVMAQEAPQTPPFLEGASPAVVSEFNTLLAGAHGQTDAQLEGKVDAWVSKQSKDIQDKFAVFKVEYKKQQAAAEAAHAQAISKFSPEAKAADARLSEVANKHTLTVKEKGEQIEAIMASLPEKVRNEIQKAMSGQ